MKLFNTFVLLTLVTVLVLPFGALAGDQGTADSALGLSKSSVFDVPSPGDFAYSEKSPGTSSVMPRSYPGAPPQIPHDIESFLPVSKASNMCLGCHNRPGQKPAKAQPTPIPPSHYTTLRGPQAGKQSKDIAGARAVCTQCHVPQAGVKELVGNSFKK